MKYPSDSLLKVVLTNNQSLITRVAGEEDVVVNAIRIGQNVMKIESYPKAHDGATSNAGFATFRNYKIVCKTQPRKSSIEWTCTLKFSTTGLD